MGEAARHSSRSNQRLKLTGAAILVFRTAMYARRERVEWWRWSVLTAFNKDAAGLKFDERTAFLIFRDMVERGVLGRHNPRNQQVKNELDYRCRIHGRERLRASRPLPEEKSDGMCRREGDLVCANDTAGPWRPWAEQSC
jgi:hypothetical protein